MGEPISSDVSGARGTRKRRRRAGRIVAIVAAVVAALIAILVVIFVVVVGKAQPPKPGSFYSLPSPLPDKPPGTIIRSESLSGLPDWAMGWKILYMSTSYTGKPTAISGMVIVPRHASSIERHVVTFANGTVGVASNCALSIHGARYLTALHGLQTYLAAGDDAVMTDYQGLGTPGPHPYLVGKSEAEAVLDSVRAAHNLRDAHAGTTFAVTGPSQGGHAALFTGQLAHTYAPDLTLVGVAASAPPTDLKELLRLKGEGTFGKVLSAFTLDAWSQVYGYNLDTVFTPAARPIVHHMVRLCLHNATQMLAFIPLTQVLKIGYLKSPPWQTEPWKTLLAENTPGKTKIPAPVLISQGGADQLVHPPVTAAFAKHLCAMGEQVEYRVYPGAVHDAGAESGSNVAKWIANRFAGKPPPSTC
ncbi:MAG: lipase family protein [Chloroflexota bacterium]|nr:lipase family protein [Chloroflexota bacterium]